MVERARTLPCRHDISTLEETRLVSENQEFLPQEKRSIKCPGQGAPCIERGMREFHPSSRGCCENGIGYKRLAADPDHGSSAGQGMQRRQLAGRRGRGRQRAVAQWARPAEGH